ncbi:MAG: hypothetical protein LUC83_09975 [Clostridiales bacterium]|nr:hypothetical protein [Clostridiales bacterium]
MMLQKLENGTIYVKPDKEQEAVIKSWRMMKQDKKRGYWYGPASIQLLQNLKRNGGLIPPAQEELERLLAVQRAVDAERVKPDAEVKPMCNFPVKANLYTHQIRAANMALLIFGLVDPEEAGHGKN